MHFRQNIELSDIQQTKCGRKKFGCVFIRTPATTLINQLNESSVKCKTQKTAESLSWEYRHVSVANKYEEEECAPESFLDACQREQLEREIFLINSSTIAQLSWHGSDKKFPEEKKFPRMQEMKEEESLKKKF